MLFSSEINLSFVRNLYTYIYFNKYSFPTLPSHSQPCLETVWAAPLSRNKEVFRYFAETYLCAHKTENGHQYRLCKNKKINFFHKMENEGVDIKKVKICSHKLVLCKLLK